MTTTLEAFSNDLSQLVATAAPGIVRVDARRRLPATGIVWSAEGHILTANHIVQRDEGIRIGLEDGSAVDAAVIGRDPSTDLALLKAEATGLQPLLPAADKSFAVGQFALGLGRPGQTVQATLGIISALGQTWRTRMGGEIDRYLQTDIVMYPGYSGGPLLSTSGTLYGLNTSGLLQGVSMAVPIGTLQRIADSLQTHGHMRRGYLGVSTQRVRLPRDIRSELDQKSGLLIVGVEPDSPAEAGGLNMGDTIVAIGESAVGRHEDLVVQLSGDRIDEKLPIKILRAGELLTLNVKVTERS